MPSVALGALLTRNFFPARSVASATLLTRNSALIEVGRTEIKALRNLRKLRSLGRARSTFNLKV